MDVISRFSWNIVKMFNTKPDLSVSKLDCSFTFEEKKILKLSQMLDAKPEKKWIIIF